MTRHSLVLAALVLALSWLGAAAETPLASPQAQLTAPAGARPKPAKTSVAPAPKDEARPTWAELSPAQQQALRPLGATWKTLTESHKRKWIALSGNFDRMPAAEQARLHSRMSEWAALSPQQRTQARLNFAAVEKVPAPDKKAAWEAYQALPPEEKRKLAAGATAVKPPPPPTAPAVRPVEPQKQAKVPPRKANPKAPGIAVAPNQVDHNTLLPQPGATLAPQN